MLIFEVPEKFHGQNLLDIASKLFQCGQNHILIMRVFCFHYYKNCVQF